MCVGIDEEVGEEGMGVNEQVRGGHGCTGEEAGELGVGVGLEADEAGTGVRARRARQQAGRQAIWV